MTDDQDGTIEESAGQYRLHFERHFPHPITRVWEALTQPERLVEWLGASAVELDLVAGGRFVTHNESPELADAIKAEHGTEAPLEVHDTVLTVEPPTLFEHTFGGDPASIARWELAPDGPGCRLVLTHTEPPGFSPKDAPRDLAGWHTLLDLLGHTVDGSPVPWTMQRWEAHRDRYAAKV